MWATSGLIHATSVGNEKEEKKIFSAQQQYVNNIVLLILAIFTSFVNSISKPNLQVDAAKGKGTWYGSLCSQQEDQNTGQRQHFNRCTCKWKPKGNPWSPESYTNEYNKWHHIWNDNPWLSLSSRPRLSPSHRILQKQHVSTKYTALAIHSQVCRYRCLLFHYFCYRF